MKLPSPSYSTTDKESFSSTTRNENSESLFSFLNGETLHADHGKGQKAFNALMYLLKGCVALNPLNRLNILEVVKQLDLLDDLLVPGTGFDNVD